VTTAQASGRGELAATAGVLLTALGWGSMVPLTALLLNDLPPFLLAATRYSTAAPVLAILVALIEEGAVVPLRLPWRRILLLGGPGIAGFGTCYTFGVWYSGPITAAAILATGPVVAAIMDRLIGGRSITRHALLAIILTVAGGVLVAVGQPDRSFSAHGGEALLVLGLVCWTWYSMKAQAWLAPLGIGQLRLTMVTSGAAGLWLWAIYGLTALLGLQPLPTAWPDMTTLAILAYLCIGPTAICIALWNHGTARLGVTIAMAILNLSPVFAVLLGVALGARPTGLQLTGGAVTLAGVAWLQFGGPRRPAGASVDDAGQRR
jgi:drug/metabolite transporter (DMT)-like permease